MAIGVAAACIALLGAGCPVKPEPPRSVPAASSKVPSIIETIVLPQPASSEPSPPSLIDPRFSDDGTSVLFTNARGLSTIRIALPEAIHAFPVTTQSTGLFLERNGSILARFPNESDREVVVAVGEQYWGSQFSPNGDWILFQEDRVDGAHIWVINKDGAERRDLGLGQQPTWLHNSQGVLFVIAEMGQDIENQHNIVASDLWFASVDGTHRVSLTTTADQVELNPIVANDGKHVVSIDGSTGQVLLSTLGER